MHTKNKNKNKNKHTHTPCEKKTRASKHASKILHYDVTIKMYLSTCCSENAYYNYVHEHSIM